MAGWNQQLDKVWEDQLEPKLNSVDVHTSGNAVVVIAKWTNGRCERWAHEPGNDLETTREVFDLCAKGLLTRDEAFEINDRIVDFCEGASQC